MRDIIPVFRLMETLFALNQSDTFTNSLLSSEYSDLYEP